MKKLLLLAAVLACSFSGNALAGIAVPTVTGVVTAGTDSGACGGTMPWSLTIGGKQYSPPLYSSSWAASSWKLNGAINSLNP